MGKWARFILALIGMCFAIGLQAAQVAGSFGSELDAGDYDCTVTLDPAATLSDAAAVHVMLEWSAENSCLRITLAKRQATFTTIHAGKTVVIGQVPTDITPGTRAEFTILRRGGTIGLAKGNALLFRKEAPRLTGKQAGCTADAGWKIIGTRIQRIEPVVFADDFMRTPTDQGAWSARSGRWALQSVWDRLCTEQQKIFTNAAFAQNPFAWVGTGPETTGAVYTTGNAFWEDYTLTAAIRPAHNGAAGLLVNMPDGQNGILVRWTPANDRSPDGNRLTLCRFSAGKRTVLASDPGGYVPGQWYKCSVITTPDGVRVLIDGRQRLSLSKATPWRGGVGLYAEGADGAVFDDITVYGHALNTDLLLEAKQSHICDRFVSDTGGMREWSTSQGEWAANPLFPGFRQYQWDVFGTRTWMLATLTPTKAAAGELWLILHGDGANPSKGYRAVIRVKENETKPTYILYRNTEKLASMTGRPFTPDTEYSLRFRRTGQQLKLEIDGETVVEAADVQPLTGLRPAYLVMGDKFTRMQDARVFSHNLYDYTFADAPTDWLADGAWAPNIRWACNPAWSFLSGWSRGTAALWHKQHLSGDQSIESYMAVKMDYPRETHTYFDRVGNFGVTLCGDGLNPRTGYAGIYGFADEDGQPYARAVIMRNGIVVASTRIGRRNCWMNHHCWFHLRLDKRGNTVTFTVKVDAENYRVSFTDTDPLEQGIPAIWTWDNGMCVARARLSFAQAPTPRHDAQVLITSPWYPEWANVGQPLPIDLSASWSTTGRPVRIAVKAEEVPPDEKNAMAVSDTRFTFTPQKAGKHWYTAAAGDGEHHSFNFNFDLTVFTPALGRDDTHALLLYRFDEGDGTTVYDRSKVQPVANFTFSEKDSGIRWLPGQGIAMHSLNPLRTATPLTKLLTIRKTKACTVEFWLSPESVFPAPGKACCFLSWQSKANGTPTNLAIGQYREYLLCTGGTTPFDREHLDTSAPWAYTSLHHVVVTWDGSVTRSYVDGAQIGQRTFKWAPELWDANFPLLIGNRQDGEYPFPGNLYLVALHDRCFSAAEIQRHYRAGPSAR